MYILLSSFMLGGKGCTFVCVCAGKRSRCGFLLIVNALILCSRVPREGPPPRTVVTKMQPLQDMQMRNDPKKGLHNVRSFIGACNFYRSRIHNFTYSSAPLTDLIKKTNLWRWTDKEEAYFQELKKKISSTNCLGVPRPKGEIILVTDACDVGGGGTLYLWQELNPA